MLVAEHSIEDQIQEPLVPPTAFDNSDLWRTDLVCRAQYADSGLDQDKPVLPTIRNLCVFRNQRVIHDPNREGSQTTGYNRLISQNDFAAIRRNVKQRRYTGKSRVHADATLLNKSKH